MSLSTNMGKITGVPHFNGDATKFPHFATKFKALVYRMGADYVQALNDEPPYAGLRTTR